jgi:hypothetical protein
MQFGHGVPGFMQLNLNSNGALDLLVWESQSADPETPVYKTKLTPGVTAVSDTVEYADVSTMPETLQLAIADFDKGGLYRFAFGERYRSVYNIPVPAWVLDLEQANGGLTPIKKGGGFQTNSLRIIDASGREYSARSMNKDASKLLPDYFRNTFASDILQDQFSASHPYAAFVIPGLADKAGVYHTNPRLVYIPKQEALGRYAEAFGDQLFLFEERPSEEWAAAQHFGGCEDIVGFDDVIEEMKEDYRNQVDQEFTLRSRLFDFFLGDWDRHDDQWRWAKCDRKDGKGHTYRPIPRDRDQAFAIYDGALISAAKLFTPAIRKLNVFKGDNSSMKWFNDNGKIFDRDFLNQITRDQWIATAEELKQTISDVDIEENIRLLAPDVFAEGGPEIIEILKERRDRLPEFAAEYYDILARGVYIRATNNADFIEIVENPGVVTIRLYDSNKEGDKQELYYDRTMYRHETKEIQIYGLAGHDHVEVGGSGSGGIRVIFVGGEDEDVATITDGKGHSRIRLQDTEPKSDVLGGVGLSYRQVGDDKNSYERSAFLYDYAIPKLLLAGNPDDGFLFGGGVSWVKHGFQKSPYASKHSIDGFFAVATSSYGLKYEGEWTDVLGKLDAGLMARFDGPTFVQNFYGFGNESVELESEDVDYYRVRKQGYAIVPFIRAGQERGSSLKLHMGVESHEVEATDGRFVTAAGSGLPDDIFDDKLFFTTGVAYQYAISDNPLFTRRGVDLNLATGLDVPLNGDDDAHQYLKASLATYYQFKHLGRPILATRVGAEWHGGDYQFYQGGILGSQGNFRGMRKQRLVGDKVFYHNTDLRFFLTRWQGYYLPAALGFQINFDHGRVWHENEDSDVWHYAYGGGVWLGIFETFLLSLNYHKSDIDQRFSVAMGFMF